MPNNMILPFDKNMHCYIQPPAESNILEQVLSQHFPKITWSLKNNQVSWPVGFKKPGVKKWNALIEQAALTELQAQAEKIIVQLSNEAREQVNPQASFYKVAAWSDKAQRARAVMADTATEDERKLLEQECELRQQDETPLQLAEKQQAKNLAYSHNMVTIEAREKIARIQIISLTHIDDINHRLHELKEALSTP
ncbi:hypothetical protein [Shewanella surugensis]|uniref:Uncharacterized protein n=1 Tax=Shewanella surugensis TaxID=212020 RepID=A0ABT0L731_9GAMM|nr:hypothetical protein [Shewanella surugensis]MCL1123190.1 hypothetical protein [Shewanella surugensis]